MSDNAIRAMVPGDAAGIAAMHHQSWVDTYGEYLPTGYFDEWTVEAAVARWERTLAGPPAPGVDRVVATADGAVVGFATAGPARPIEDRPAPVRPFELWGLYVARDELGSGLGQRLLDTVLPADRPAELWVFADNARARAFYARNGFRDDGTAYRDRRFPDLREARMVRGAAPIG